MRVTRVITKITGSQSQLVRYTVNAITGGADAQGEVSCIIEDRRHPGFRAGRSYGHHYGKRFGLYQRSQQTRGTKTVSAGGGSRGTMNYKIAVLPGDGIGPEVMSGGNRRCSNRRRNCTVSALSLKQGVVGGASIDAHGKPLIDSVLKLAKESDAVLLGAMGGPKWDGLDYSIRPERALLALRQELGLFANLRPVKVFAALASASTFKREVVEGTDLTGRARTDRRHLFRAAQRRDQASRRNRARREHGSLHDAGDRAHRARGLPRGAQAAQESDVGR